jgi:hypothetical protein
VQVLKTIGIVLCELLQSIGKNVASLMLPILQVLLREFDPGEHGYWTIAIDDSPTNDSGNLSNVVTNRFWLRVMSLVEWFA